jgi:hypothetical protein
MKIKEIMESRFLLRITISLVRPPRVIYIHANGAEA